MAEPHECQDKLSIAETRRQTTGAIQGTRSDRHEQAHVLIGAPATDVHSPSVPRPVAGALLRQQD